MNGVLLIRKEKAFTSFDVVAVVRRLLGQKKAGHTGTLDPNATGILPVLLGSATKAQDIIPCQDKRYTADFRLGIATDTLDIWDSLDRLWTHSAERSNSSPRCIRRSVWTASGSISTPAKESRWSADRAR